MNDEHLHPVPDESSPVRHRRMMILLRLSARPAQSVKLCFTRQDDDNNDPIQPAVNKLKKRQQGKATAFLAFAAVALIALAWGVTGYTTIFFGSRVKKSLRKLWPRQIGPILDSVPIWVRTISTRKHQNRRTTTPVVRHPTDRRLCPT